MSLTQTTVHHINRVGQRYKAIYLAIIFKPLGIDDSQDLFNANIIEPANNQTASGYMVMPKPSVKKAVKKAYILQRAENSSTICSTQSSQHFLYPQLGQVTLLRS